MSNGLYLEADYNSAIKKHIKAIKEHYHYEQDLASDVDYFNGKFIETNISIPKSKIWTNPIVFEFFNTYTNKSRLSKLTRFEIIQQYAVSSGFEIGQLADLIAQYDALMYMWDYIIKQNYFTISTQEIYSQLRSKWGDGSIIFSNEEYLEIENNIVKTLSEKDLTTTLIEKEDLVGQYEYIFNRYPKIRKATLYNDEFRIPRYIVFHKKNGIIDLELLQEISKTYEGPLLKKLPENYSLFFLEEDECFINVNDESFDFFFALQLRLNDIMHINKFLSFHLKYTFDNDMSRYVNFLTLFKIKYKQKIGTDLVSIINNFALPLNEVVYENVDNPHPKKKK